MGKRNFDLMSRNENTREKVQRKVVRFEIRQIRQHFEESLCAIHAQFTVADDLWHSGKKEEAENIWRAQIIFLASAFDFYMHELTKYGLCEIYEDYYFSRNLEHVLHNINGELSDEEKEELAFETADQYSEHPEQFLQFLCDSSFCVSGTYGETWKFIMENGNSLKRYSNMAVFFENLGVIPEKLL